MTDLRGVSEPARVADADEGISTEELQLAARNHGLPLEALSFDVTPAGLHYLLVHYDVPVIDPAGFRLVVDGLVHTPLSLDLDAIRRRPRVSAVVTLECAGNGRAGLLPRPVSQPWLVEAVGTARWTGTPLAAVLREAGVRDGAVEVVFTGADHGVERGVEQDYQRSLTVADCLREDVLLAYEMNDAPLPPQHGFPLRLRGARLVRHGARQVAHRDHRGGRAVRRVPDAGLPAAAAAGRGGGAADPHRAARPASCRRGSPTSCPAPGSSARAGRSSTAGPGRDGPRSPPSRSASTAVAAGRRRSWRRRPGQGWVRWTWPWDAAAGRYRLAARAHDASGRSQPVDPPWNRGGFANNAVQRVPVLVLD